MSTVSDPSTLNAVFRVEGVTKTYHVGEVDVHALRGINLELYQGEFVVLLGPSGSGKSTLLNILGGLDVPSAGTVQYCNHHLARRDRCQIENRLSVGPLPRGTHQRGSHAACTHGLRAYETLTNFDDRALTIYRRQHVGFVFQFYNLIPSLTARENVALITDIADDPMDPTRALEWVGLADRKDHFPAQLSGGEQQRVAIARAIAKQPNVLLCDEPTGALDVKTGGIVLDVIQRINEELGTTTAIITHNAVIADMADRVITLTDGRVQETRRNSKKKRVDELAW